MFSIFTLSLRVCHPIFYNAYNCVDGGPYKGWKALSALLGILQAIVQFLAAMILLGLYIYHRGDDSTGLSEDHTAMPPETSSPAIQIAVGMAGFVVLAVSFTFLIINQNEMFDPDQLTTAWFIVYFYGLGIWLPLLLLANMCFLVLPFYYQIKIVLALHSHGSLSLVSLAMQTVAFIVLAVLQAAREWRSILWPQGPGDFSSPARFAEWFYAFYCTTNTHLAYLLTGVETLILLIVRLLETRHNGEGRIAI